MELIDEKAQEWYDVGVSHLDAVPPNLSTAVSCFSHALYLRPSPVLYQHRGECFLRLGDFQSAISNFSHALHLEPGSPALISRLSHLHYLQARLAHDDGDMDSAVKHVEQAVKLQPQNTDFWILRIKILISCQKYGVVLNELTHFITLHPAASPSSAVSTAVSTANSTLPSAAVTPREVAEITTRLPLSKTRLVQTLILRAKLYLLLSRVDLALTDINQLYILAPANKHVKQLVESLAQRGEMMYSNAIAHILAGHTHDAIVHLTRALELSPDSPPLYKLRSSLYRESGKFDEALKDLKAGLAILDERRQKQAEARERQKDNLEEKTFLSQLDQDDEKDDEYLEFEYHLSLTYNSLGLSYYSAHNFANALTCFSAALGLVDMPQYHMNRGDVYASARQWEQALEDYETCKKGLEQPLKRVEEETHRKQDFKTVVAKIAKIHNEIGKELFNVVKYAEACLSFSRSISCDPSVGLYYYNRARCLLKSGAHVEAYRDADRAVQLDPAHAEARQFLLQLRHNLMRPEDAAKLPPLPPINSPSAQATTNKHTKNMQPGEQLLNFMYPAASKHSSKGVKQTQRKKK